MRPASRGCLPPPILGKKAVIVEAVAEAELEEVRRCDASGEQRQQPRLAFLERTLVWRGHQGFDIRMSEHQVDDELHLYDFKQPGPIENHGVRTIPRRPLVG